MSYILRSAGFTPGGSPSWPLSQPPSWRGFAGVPAPGFSAGTIWWQPGDVLALDFVNGRYMREGGAASLAAVLSASRTSPATWFTQADVLRTFAANAPAITDRGLYAGEQRINKCRNFNANPTDLTGVSKAGDAAATLTLVDDTAELAAAGLGEVCTSGMAFKLDNSAGATNAQAYVTGNSGNTNVHTMSVYMRSTGSVRMVLSSSGGTNWTGPAVYTRLSATVTPANSSQQLVIEAAAGKIVWFVLNQLEEGSFASPPVVTEGGTGTTRLADAITIPDFAATAAASGLEGGFAGEAIVDVTRLADSASRLLWDFGAGISDRACLEIAPDNTVELSVKAAGAGPVLSTAALGSTGQYTLEWQVLSGASAIKVNGAVAASSSATFTMPSLTDGYIGQSRSGASHLNEALRELHLRGAAA